MATKTVTVLLKAITGAYRAEMTKAAAATASVGTAASGTGRASQFLTRHLGPTGFAALKVAAGFAAAGGLTAAIVGSGKAAIDFEADFTRVRKTVDGGEFELDRLALGFRRLATEMPTSTEELTRVGEAAGQLGISKDNILSFTRTMIDLGNTTNLTAEDAALALARLANITKMPQSEFRKLGSVLVELGNNFAASEAEIAEMATRLAGAGHQIGLTESEILALSTTLTSVNVKAEAGGSAFSRVFTRMQTAVMDAGAELDLFAQVAGVTAEEFARTFERRPAEAIQAFIEGFGRLQESGVNTETVLRGLSLSELRVADAIRRTAGAGSLLGRTFKAANDELSDTNALNVESARHADTAAAKIKILGNSIKDLGITIGSASLEAISGTVEKTTDEVNDLNRAFQAADRGVNSFKDRVAEAIRNVELFNNTTERGGQGVIPRFVNRTGAAADAARFAGRAVADWRENVVLVNRELADQNRFTSQVEASSRDAADAALEAADGFAGQAKTVEQAAKQMDALRERQEELEGAVTAFFDPLKNYNDLLDRKTEKERESAEASANATGDAKKSWEDFVGVVKVSGQDVIGGMQDQIDAFNDWRKNLKTIAARGRGDIAAELAAMGPEGAGLVAAFAGMTDKEFKKAGDLWNKQQKQNANKLTDTLEAGLADATGKADKGARAIGDKIAVRTKAGIKIFGGLLDKTGPTVKEALADAADKGDKGARNVSDRIEVRTKTGVKTYGGLMDKTGPSTKAGLKEATSRGREGAQNTADAMNNKIQGGLIRWARKVDGYAGSLRAGLNPVIANIGGKKIAFADAAAARFAGRYSADGGMWATPSDGLVPVAQSRMLSSRPAAHIASKPTVMFGEPETGGEAYIPLAGSKRPRSRMIADETVSRLGGEVQWFAKGGFNSISDVPKVPSGDGTVIGRTARVAMGHTRREVVKWLKENLAPELGGGVGWKKMWAAMSARFPGARLISGFRPGAITATGNRSYHGMGRAIDVSPWHKIAQWIRDNYMSKTREMIFSPFGGKQIHNGGNHVYTGITRAMHWDHVHWAMRMGGIISKQIMKTLTPQALGAPIGARADHDLLTTAASAPGKNRVPFGIYDDGGLLPAGLSLAYNGLGRPEPVGAQAAVNVQVFVGDREITDIVDVRLDHRARQSRQLARKGA